MEKTELSLSDEIIKLKRIFYEKELIVNSSFYNQYNMLLCKYIKILNDKISKNKSCNDSDNITAEQIEFIFHKELSIFLSEDWSFK